MSYTTLKVRFEDTVCFVQMDCTRTGNAISERLVTELADVLTRCEAEANVVVLSGTPEVFCVGADFRAIRDGVEGGSQENWSADPLYQLWHRLASGPFVSIAHVRGKANAGGVGFVAACDIVLAAETSRFSLSEMLFGVLPACVLPFLIRRIGFQRANYLTLSTQPIGVAQAAAWGLVDASAADSEDLLRRYLLRMRRLSRPALRRYKDYVERLNPALAAAKPLAVAANLEAFSDPHALRGIARYVDQGLFPWEH